MVAARVLLPRSIWTRRVPSISTIAVLETAGGKHHAMAPLLADRVAVIVFAPLQSRPSPLPRLPPLHHTSSLGACAESVVVLCSGTSSTPSSASPGRSRCCFLCVDPTPGLCIARVDPDPRFDLEEAANRIANPLHERRRSETSPSSRLCSHASPAPSPACVDRTKSHDRPHAPGLPHLRLLTASNEHDAPAPAPGPPLLRPSGSPPSREAQRPMLASFADGPSPCFGFVPEL